MRKIFALIDTSIEKVTRTLLIICVTIMILISVASIILRWNEISFIWIDQLVRHLVFFTAFLGGVLATGNRGHICIDLLGKYLDEKSHHKILWSIRLIVPFASFLVLLWLIIAGIDFVKMERLYGKIAFLGIHSSVLVSIIPFGLSLICFRFFNLFIQQLTEER